MRSVNFRILGCVALALVSSSCLRTRAQLRDDGETEGAKPVPAQIQEVQPQGQYVLDEIKGELTRLTGRLEDLEHNQKNQADPGKAAQKEDVQKLERRIVELEQAQLNMLEAIKKMQSSAPPPDAQESFDRGKAQLESGHYDGAIENLTNYLKIPDAKKAEEATFLRGEAYFASKQYKKAIVDYGKFPEKYSRSKRMPAVLLKLGLSFEALGMKSESKDFLAELVDKFPKSAEAKKAKSKLK